MISLRFISFLAGIGLLSATSIAHGQATPVTQLDQSVSIGYRAGYSSYTMEGKEVDLHTQTGNDELRRAQWFTLGAVVRKRLYKPFSLQAEVNYLREGGSFKGNYFLGKTVYTINCLQIPLLLNLKLPVGEHLSLHVEGGMALTVVLDGVVLDMPNFAPQNNFSNPSSLFSPVYGAELAWQQGQQTYFFNARLTHDLTDFYQREYFGTHYNARSNGFSLTVGALFGL